MATVNINLADDCGGTSTPSTPGLFTVRAFYAGTPDAGHVYDRFTTRERAEQCLLVLASRSDVRRAVIEIPTS